MALENMKLHCVQCGVDFDFTANEQAFFAQRGLTSLPKRCKACRKQMKAGAQAAGGQRTQGQKGKQGPQRQGRSDYRSPAFRDQARGDFGQDYRSPAFRDIDKINPEEEYRAPGFREREQLDVRGEYRAPGFQDLRDRQRDERPLFEITCAECQQVAMVPYLPEEKEGPHLCTGCYAIERKRLAQEHAAAQAAAAVEAAAAAKAAAAAAEAMAPPVLTTTAEE